jgi:hypothetical protein
MEIDDGERAAIDALAGSGLVPPLRLVLALEPVDPERSGGGGDAVGRTGETAAAG